MKTISLSDAVNSLTRSPGILLGPDVTCIPGAMDGLLKDSLRVIGASAERYKEEAQRHFRSAMDGLAIEMPDQYGRLRDEIEAQIRLMKPSLDLPHLARAGWSACISLTDDLLFEAALRDHLDRVPSSRSATVIDEVGMSLPERTVPIYKLIGSLGSRDDKRQLALSESELTFRLQDWPDMLRSAPDFVREAPLFVLGTASVVQQLKQVLGLLSGQARPHISKLVFLKDDLALRDTTVQAICRKFETVIVDATLRDLCDALVDLRPKRSAPEPDRQSMTGLEIAATSHERIVAILPRNDVAQDATPNMLSLIDGLFRPTSIDWQPFAAGLDLRRTATDQLKEAVKGVQTHQRVGSLNFIVVRGEAGVGKTILMKRTAFELAKDGPLVLWCRRASPGWTRTFRSLATDLAERVREYPDRPDLLVFCDDPWGLRMDAADLMGCFDRFPGRVTFVFALRNSDFFSEKMSLTVSSAGAQEFELSYELDESEWQSLGVMLQKIGAVGAKSEADKLLREVPSRHARDILCSLWYLVPETQSQLSESLRDEYCRLGSVKGSVEIIAQDLASTSEIAKRAYEFVTVTSHLGLGLPVEVLVRALKIDYAEWIEMIVDGRPLWGLLYDEVDPENGNVLFRTRNEIVTRVLLDLVNGGVGHAGEFRVLSDLLRACDGGSAVYRGFTIEVLVRSRQKLQKMLTFEQGIDLFDIARQALRFDDRLLEHHRGIWIDDVGNDSKQAYLQLEKALRSEIHPSSERDPPVEHIHTSMASSLVKLIKSGEQDPGTGFQTVRDHLRQASTSKYFNAHSAHVAANLFFELAQPLGGIQSEEIRFGSISEALQEIERALQLIGGQGKNHFRDEKSITMLSDLQRRIVRSVTDTSGQRDLALKIFKDTRQQSGFEAVARCLLAEAAVDDKGGSYNKVKDYLDEIQAYLESNNSAPSAELLAVRVDLTIRWRIQRLQAVDWPPFLETIKSLLNNARYSDDAIKKFYYAVALFHDGQLTESNAIFAGLRRVQLPVSPREVRCCYVGKEGAPKRMQGILEKKHDYGYLNLSDLQLSVPMKTVPAGYGSNRLIHAYIVFTLNGPSAVIDRPGDDQLRLP